MSLTQVFYLESIDGNSSGQEQSGQWDRLKVREFACGQGKWAPKPGSSIWRVSTAGAGIVEFIDGSWLKCRPVGKVMWTISLRRLKRAPEHFVLFEGKYKPWKVWNSKWITLF